MNASRTGALGLSRSIGFFTLALTLSSDPYGTCLITHGTQHLLSKSPHMLPSFPGSLPPFVGRVARATSSYYFRDVAGWTGYLLKDNLLPGRLAKAVEELDMSSDVSSARCPSGTAINRGRAWTSRLASRGAVSAQTASDWRR